MNMPDNRIRELLDKLLRNDCSQDEKNELFLLLQDIDDDDKLTMMLEDAWNAYQQPTHSISRETADTLLQTILEGDRKVAVMPAGRKRIPWIRVSVAASVIVLIGLAAYFSFFNNSKTAPETATIITNDVKPPETNRATITLSNGQTVYLDSVGNGQLAMQGKIKLVKLANGSIAYESADGSVSREMMYNTLANPRGSQVATITLMDGSKVWLNAGSSITYPVAFIGNERKVTIDGEAYFEITTNTAMPFKVAKGSMEVQVLGTHFNVNAFEDEANVKVTLLEGSVKVISGSVSGVLKPGQQAQVDAAMKIVEDVNLEQVMAWKNGLFSFESSDIKTIMRELARWYDIDIEYATEVQETFYVKLDRNTSVSSVFKILETTGGVHFDIKGKKIIVKP